MGSQQRGSWGSDRGQILVLSALLIAVMFVGLALVLNSAVYTENLAARDTGSTAGPVTQQAVAEERMTRVLAESNFGDETASYEQRARRARSNVSSWSERVGGQAAREGRVSTTSVSATRNGTRVSQSTSGDFMPAERRILDEVDGEQLDPMGVAGRTNWLVVPNASTRAFSMTVERDSLAPTRQGLLDDLGDLVDTILTGSDEFWVQFESESGTQRVYLADDVDEDTVAVVVTEIADGSENVVGECTGPPNNDEVTVRVSAAEIEADGDTVSCPALNEIDAGRHDVGYVGADEVEGTYRLIADRPEAEYRQGLNNAYQPLVNDLLGVLNGLLNPLDPLLGSLTDMIDLLEDFTTQDVLGDNSGEQPYTTTAIYSVTVEQVYVDDRITYSRNVTVAPVSPATKENDA